MTDNQISKPFEILLIEDNPGDVLLTKEALKESKFRYTLNVVANGCEALDYLFCVDEYANAVRPDIIFMDLNLPKKNGLEVLDTIKNNDNLKDIPVIVLTSSSFEQDINYVYKKHANCFITKPADFVEFLDVMKSIFHFWFNVVKLPRKD